MPQQRLTDRTLAPYITGDTLIHIVNTGDTSQYFAGSSYKATIDQISNYYQNNYDIYTTGTTFGSNQVILTRNDGFDTFKLSGGSNVTLTNPSTNQILIDVISETFTGNTSGDCISDIFITNLHSCSPLFINPNDEGDIYIGSNSGFTYDLTNSSTLIKGDVVGQSDSLSLSTIISQYQSSGIKGSIKYFSHTGTTMDNLFNPNVSGSSKIQIGVDVGVKKDIEISYYGSSYLRSGTPTTGVDFWQNKAIIKTSQNSNGLVNTNLSTKPTYWENQENCRMILTSDGKLGIGLNPDGTELPTETFQIGGTGTTGTFKYVDGNQVNGYVLTSDSDGNATWQESTGSGEFTGGTVTGATIFTNGLTADTTTISGSAQNILTIIGSGDTQPLFTVQGSSGELFSITDSLVGDLFSINNISGLPILKVTSDDEIFMGASDAPSLNTTLRSTPTTGLTSLYSFPMSAYTGAWFEYNVSNTGGTRSGSIMSVFSGNTAVSNDFGSTAEIGTTSDVTFSVSADTTNAYFQVSATTEGWTIKTIIRSI